MDLTPLPRRTRPRIYAGCELFLDMLWSVRSRAPDMDLETLLIFLVANEAAMRPLLVGPNARLDLMDHPAPPDEARGSISRNLIADRTALPRETVRRKVNQLITLGLFTETREGEVRPKPMLADVMFQQIADESYQAVVRYDARLRTLGCEGVMQPPESSDAALPQETDSRG
ncbi:MAG: hypothetical protein AB7H66_07390 [Hyphomonadaceae bacterium]